MTSLLDNLDCSSDSDDIHRLFPKCRRPTNSNSTCIDINLNTIYDDNDNRVMMLGVMQQTDSCCTLQSLTSGGNGPQSSGASPSPAPTTHSSVSNAELLMDTMPNANGLSSCVERRGADADDEEDGEEEEDDERDESMGGSQGGGDSSSPLTAHEEIQNGTTSFSRKYNKHLRDSRIEIAGGREVFSQSKSKAARKRYSDDSLGAAAAAAAAVGTVSSLAGPRNIEDKVGVWEVRGGRGGEQLKKVRNVPAIETAPSTEMVTETVFSTEVRSIRRISDARYRLQSGVVPFSTTSVKASSLPASNTCSNTPVVYEVPMTGVTEVVVFDDIGECLAEQLLKCGRHTVHSGGDDDTASAGSSSTGRDTPPSFHRPPADFFKVQGPGGADVDTDALSPERSRAPRVIGGLPIAEYEGSPRRYGPRPKESQSPLLHNAHAGLPSAESLLSSPSVFPPRPGFPQRIVQTPPHEEQRPETPPPSHQQPLMGTDPGAYDFLYEFSETRKVLEEFFKPNSPPPSSLSQTHAANCSEFHELDYNLHRQAGNSYVGQRLAKDGASPLATAELDIKCVLPSSPPRFQHKPGGTPDLISLRDHEDSLGGDHMSPSTITQPSFLMVPEQELQDAVSNAAEEDLAETEVGLQVGHSRNFTLSPETTDCDSNDIESEVSLENEGSMHSSGGGHLYGSMPVLEDGLSSGHASDAEDSPTLASTLPVPMPDANPTVLLMKKQICEIEREIRSRAHKYDAVTAKLTNTTAASTIPVQPALDFRAVENFLRGHDVSFSSAAADLDSLGCHQDTPPPPAPQPHRNELQASSADHTMPPENVEAAIKDICMALQRTKALPLRSSPAPDTSASDEDCNSPVWVPRYEPLIRNSSPPMQTCSSNSDSRTSPPLLRRHQPPQPTQLHQNVSCSRVTSITVALSPPTPAELERKTLPGPSSDDAADEEELDTDLETDRLLGQQRIDDQGFFDDKDKDGTKKKGRNKEVLIEGVLFRARYLGSTQLVCEGQPTKTTRMMQAEEAVSRIKALAPEGENQPSTEVDLFISTEKIMVLNTDLKEIMMDHALRTISYIADIGDLVVLMARRRYVPQDVEEAPKINRTPKMICHVFESDEAQFIAQSIGQAFQVAYMEFLKANGIEDHSFVKEMDYQEVLNSQEIFGDELQMFAKKEMQKEVVVPKAKGEILGVVIVESGWGSMLPTVVIANLAPAGAAARCGQLNIGDQIIAINGVSLVGLPLSTCQNYIKNTKNQTVVKLTVVPCAPVVEVKIKRPDTKYQLGFSVQNGVICSLLRGGIAERGGVRVGHRIIEINNQSVVAVPHEKIVNLLATSVGEILMKTMPTSMFRLLTGQETPVYI